MVYARSAVAPRVPATPEISKKPARAKRSPLRRLFDAVEQANMQRAEREIARYLSRYGDRFTDETEREIERRFLSNR
jgi:hypothetical protein